MRGYGIAIRIQQISVEVFQVNPGSLFPAFNRLELLATFTRVGAAKRGNYPHS